MAGHTRLLRIGLYNHCVCKKMEKKIKQSYHKSTKEVVGLSLYQIKSMSL